MENLSSVAAEQNVLGAILINSGLLADASEIISTDDFYVSSHREIFSAMLILGGDFDVISLADHLHKVGNLEHIGGLNYLVELQSNTASTNIAMYANIVRDYAKKRGLLVTLNSAANEIMGNPGIDADHLIADVASRIGGMQIADGEGLRNTTQILKSLVDQWDRKANSGNVIDGFATGLTDLDDRFLGWKPGDLVVIAGRPSMGKSLLAFQIGIRGSVDRACRVLGFSLEMTAERILERATANIGNVPLSALRRCTKEDFGEYSNQIGIAAQKLKSADFLIDETPGLHINQIQARARAAHRKKPLDLVIVDHVNIASGGQKNDGEVAQLTDISKGLKALAKELGCPVVAVTQLNRGVEQRPDKRPKLSDLRGSGTLEQDADIVILMYRDDYYHEESMYAGVVELNTAKFREGEVGTDRLANQFGYSRIADLSPQFYQQLPTGKPQQPKGFD